MLVDPSSSCSCSSPLLWKSATDTAVSLWDVIDVTVRLSGCERAWVDKFFLVIFVLRFNRRCWALVLSFWLRRSSLNSKQLFAANCSQNLSATLLLWIFSPQLILFMSDRRGLTRAFILWSQYQIVLVLVKAVLFAASSRWPDFDDYCSYSFVCFGLPRCRTHPSPKVCPYRHSCPMLVAMTANSACLRSSIM